MKENILNISPQAKFKVIFGCFIIGVLMGAGVYLKQKGEAKQQNIETEYGHINK